MNDYSYHTVSSIINAFEKSVNFHFNWTYVMSIYYIWASPWDSSTLQITYMYIGFKHLPGPEGHVINRGGGGGSGKH